MRRSNQSSAPLSDFKSSRDELIHRYQKFVHHVVAKMVSHLNLPSALYDEYVSAGYLGLVEAAERFDRRQGTNFKTFAFLRIRGSVIDSIRSTSELQGRAYRYAKALKNSLDLQELSRQEGCRRPGNEGAPEHTVANILDYLAKSALSFRLSMADAEQEVIDIEDDAPGPERHYEGKEDRALLTRLLQSLPENERKVIEDFYFKDRTLTEMAAGQEAHSKSWLSRLHARALEHLKERYLALQKEGADEDCDNGQ